MEQKLSVNRKIFYGISSGIILTIVSVIISLVQFKLILDFLPKDLVGIWLVFLTIAAYVGLFDLGIGPTMSREIGFVIGDTTLAPDEKQAKIINIIATALKMFQVIAIIVFVLGFILGCWFLLTISNTSHHNLIIISWLVFIFGASLNLWGNAWFSVLFGLGHVATERSLQSISKLIGLGISILVLYLGYGLLGLAIAWVIQGIATRMLARNLVYRYHKDWKLSEGKASLEIFKKIMGPGLKWAIMGVGATLTLQTDNVIIAAILGPSFVPAYEAIARILTTFMTFTMLIATSSTPFITHAYAAGDSATQHSLLLRGVRYSMAAMIIVVILLWFFGQNIITFWIGSENFVGYPVIFALSIMFLLEVHSISLGIGAMATGRVIFMKVTIISGILNIIISLILVKYLGLLGVALGTMIAQLLTNHWYVPYISLKTFNISIFHYAKTILLPLFLFFIILFLLTFNIKYYTILLPELYIIFLIIPLIGILGVISSIILIMPKNEKYILMNKIQQIILQK